MSHGARLTTSRAWWLAVLAFGLAALLSGALIWQLETSRVDEARAQAYSLATERAQAVQSNMERAFSAAYALGAMIRQGRGELPEFTATAKEMLPFYPGVGSLQLAKDGVVTHVVPLAGNEKAIGHNLLADPARNKEAFLARDTARLTLAGPFTLLQGGLGAVARLPVYLENPRREPDFWGFVAVLMHFPQALEPAQLPLLVERGFHYELWRTHPDTHQKQVIASSGKAPLANPVTRDLVVPNATWHLDLSPVGGWTDQPGLLFKSALGLLFSLLLAGIVKLLMDGKLEEKRLEERVAQRTQDLQRFAEVTAHHLQEPARRLATYADRLARQLTTDPGDPEAQMSLRFIGEQARRMKGLLADVERYLAADQPRGPMQLTQPADVLRQVQTQMQERLRQADAEFDVGVLPAVWMDAARLKEVFQQALDNALAFARPQAGTPLRLRVDGQTVGYMARLRLCDNGPGLEADEQERAFRVFERQSPQAEGNGIGLAIVRRMCQSCGGRAWIASAQGGGCCLMLELPSREPK